MEHAKFRVNETNGEVTISVCDEASQALLESILNAPGGSTDTTATIFNVNITLANTEVSQVLPANTKNFLIRSRNKGKLRLAYSLGGTSANYVTIPSGSSFVDNQFYSGQTIYFETTKPGDVIEIVAYS